MRIKEYTIKYDHINSLHPLKLPYGSQFLYCWSFKTNQIILYFLEPEGNEITFQNVTIHLHLDCEKVPPDVVGYYLGSCPDASEFTNYCWHLFGRIL